MTHKEIIAVVEAHRQGKPIQWRFIDSLEESPWRDDERERARADFNFYSYDYRIKPEPPKPREWRLYLWNKSEATGCFDLGSQPAPAGMDGEYVHVREVL